MAEDKKLTDSEIKQVLEDTLHRIKGAGHLIVPKEGVKNLCNGLQNALDLINRLQAENEEYKADKEQYIKDYEELENRLIYAETETKFEHQRVLNLQAENERLKSKVEPEGFEEADPMDFGGVLCDFAEELIAKAKAEAYKECIEKVKENFTEQFCGQKYDLIHSWFNNVLKELIGE